MQIRDFIHTWRNRLPQIGIVITLLMLPFWAKLPDAPPPFTARYVTGFWVVIPMSLTILAWILSGFVGMKTFAQSKVRIAWIITLTILVLWSYASQTWAFVAENHYGVAQNATLHLALIVGFAFVVACASPPYRIIISLFVLMLIFHSIIGGLQVARQASLFNVLGEPYLHPYASGVSVIQSGDSRWLRPYGFLTHPNIYAGILVILLMGSLGWILTQVGFRRFIGLIAFGIGYWVLLLTFSRAGWGAFAIGFLAILPFLWEYASRKWLIGIISLTVVLVMSFFLLYRPFISARTGDGFESIELRSVSDRVVFAQIGYEAILESPIVGHGGGNYPWYAARYLHDKTDFDLRGDNAHNIYLQITAEYGLLGFGLFILSLIFGIEASLRAIRQDEQHRLIRLGLLAGIIAVLMVGFLDHYPMTLIQTQTLFFTIIALALMPMDTPHSAR